MHSQMHNSEIYTSGTRTEKLLENYLLNELGIELLAEQLFTGNKLLHQSMNLVTKSKYTELLGRSDGKLTNSFLSIKDVINISQRRNDRVIAEAGRELEIIVKTIGSNIHRQGYKKQLAKMTKLKTELQKPMAKSLINKTKQKEIFEELFVDIDNFKELMAKRDKEQLGRENSQSDEARRMITGSISNIQQYLELMSIMKTEKVYAELLNKLNDLITNSNSTIKQRITRRENAKEQSEAVQQTEEMKESVKLPDSGESTDNKKKVDKALMN